jgi:signal transduction histidine kinase
MTSAIPHGSASGADARRGVPAGGSHVTETTFDWGEAYTAEEDLHSRVLVDRAYWVVRLRWGAVGACGLGTLASMTNLVPERLHAVYFASVTVFLALSNWVYGFLVRRWSLSSRNPTALKRLVIVQVATDYLSLSVVNYATGTLETPFFMLFLPHVILLSLFFSRRLSLFMTAVGVVLALLPLVLESMGVVPLVSILDLPFKERVLQDPKVTFLFVAGLSAAFFFCWYLTSTITSSLKYRENQLQMANDALVRLDREKTQATLRATHELKAPFAAIQSYVYTLRDGYYGDLPAEALDVIRRIDDRCDRLKAMISDIIHLSNLRTLVVSNDDFEPVDLRAFIRDEVEDAALVAKRRSITVLNLVAEEGGVPMVRASSRHLRTLVSNLLRNAVNYSHDGGKVEVGVEAVGGGAVLRVRDYGIGIAQELLPKLFDDFFRSNAAVKHNPNGNGLGLAMVKEIAKLHGAVIEVSSEEGKGTCFSVAFKPMPDTRREEPMAKILIIDDDQDISESLTRVLEKNGFTVQLKRDTTNLLTDVRKADPDLILLDVMFPEDPQAGFKAARDLRGDEKLAKIPVLVLSAVNQRSGMGFGFSDQDISDDFMPVEGFIEKPVEPKVLLERINQLLGQRT